MAEQDVRPSRVEELARELCDTWYLTVDPNRPMFNAWEKIARRTQQHWIAQADLLVARGWVRT